MDRPRSRDVEATAPLGTPLIVAEASADRRDPSTLLRLRAALDARGVPHDVHIARADAGVVAREAVTTGRRYLVAVGDDGTVHDIVNGLVDPVTGHPLGEDPVLGIVGAGPGCDLSRTFGLDRTPDVLVDHLASGATLRIDLGRIRLVGPDGSPTSVVFANVAQAGFGARAVAAGTRLPGWAGNVRRPAGLLAAWAGARRVAVRVDVDGGSRTEPLSNVVVANGQFSGGGMLLAPRALPSDGRFNVQSWATPPRQLLRTRRRFAQGAHLPRDDVREWQSATVEIRASRPLTVEADGRIVGRTPASFDVLPQILALKI